MTVTRPGPPPDHPSARTDPWDPATAAAGRPGLVVVDDPVAALLGGGFVVRRGDRVAIVLDPELHPWQRRAALAHELVHAERGLLDRDGAPPGWELAVEREERRVREVVADRLAPPVLVAAHVERSRRADEPVTAAALAAELEVPLEVAELALRRLGR